MRRTFTRKLLPKFAIVLAVCSSNAGFASEADHKEFEATLHAPYTGDAAAGARVFTLDFDYPLVERAQDVAWRIELVSAAGDVLQRWHGAARLAGKPVSVAVPWGGKADSRSLPDGVYQVRMQAIAQDAAGKGKLSDADVVQRLDAGADDVVEQSWEIRWDRSARLPCPHSRR